MLAFDDFHQLSNEQIDISSNAKLGFTVIGSSSDRRGTKIHDID